MLMLWKSPYATSAPALKPGDQLLVSLIIKDLGARFPLSRRKPRLACGRPGAAC